MANIHTSPSYSFAHYCAEMARAKSKNYFNESFSSKEMREAAFGPHNGCKGECEGTGFVPIHKDDMREPFRSLWVAAERNDHSQDGYHFVGCPTCKNRLEEHIIQHDGQFILKSKRTGKHLGTFPSKEAAKKREAEIQYFRSKPTVKESLNEAGRSSVAHDDSADQVSGDEIHSPDEKKQKEKQKRALIQRDRDKKHLLPYEFDKTKDAERQGGHLGIKGNHLVGNGIYKPGTNDFILRNAVAKKKAKQKIKSGRGVTEDYNPNYSNRHKVLHKLTTDPATKDTPEGKLAAERLKSSGHKISTEKPTPTKTTNSKPQSNSAHSSTIKPEGPLHKVAIRYGYKHTQSFKNGRQEYKHPEEGHRLHTHSDNFHWSHTHANGKQVDSSGASNLSDHLHNVENDVHEDYNPDYSNRHKVSESAIGFVSMPDILRRIKEVVTGK